MNRAQSASEPPRPPRPSPNEVGAGLADPERNARAALIVASFAFILLSSLMNVASTGFLETDGVTHYLYARFAFENPAFLVDVWGRPVRTILHAIPAHFFGLHGVRAMSCAIAIACAWLTYGIARRLGWRRAGLAGCFVLAQPLLFLHSFAELTELPFAMLAAGAFLAMLGRRWWAFALLCGLTPAARPEGAAFLMLGAVVLGLHRRWQLIPLVFIPLVIWNHAGWTLWGHESGPWWRWLIDQFPYSGKSTYQAGPIWRFLAVLPFVVSPLLLPAVLFGTAGVLRDPPAPGRPPGGNWLIARETWLIAAIPWGILAVHSILHATGRMASSGEPRYLLAAAPFWALLACRGWDLLATRFRWSMPIAWATAAAVLAGFVNVFYRVLPLARQPDAVMCQRLAESYRNSSLPQTHPVVFATHPLMYFSLDRMVQDAQQRVVLDPPAGAIFFYDSANAANNADRRRVLTPELFAQGGWRELPTPFRHELPGQEWRIFLSPRVKTAAATHP